jgi:AcrR family transcriptional regulator
MEDKKQYILKNVGALYLKYGIRSVTMDDVASEFGISKKTLYQYFNDKADLISQVIDYYIEQADFAINNRSQTNAIDRFFELRSHVLHMLKFIHNNIEYDLKKLYPDIYRKVHKLKRERIFNSTIQNVTEGIASGLYRADLDIVFIAKLQVGRMLLILNPEHEIFTETELANIDLFDKVIENYMYSICTEKGIKYYKEQLNSIKNEVEY